MKTLLCFIIVSTLLFAGCTNTVNNEKTEDGSTTLRSELDTFYWGNKLATVEIAKQTDFDKLPSSRVDTSESKNLIKDSLCVKRKGDTLSFLVANNKKTILVNNNSDNEDYVNYNYIGQVKNLNQYIVYVAFYEWFDCYLIDKQTGDITKIGGNPAVSPDKSMFVTGNADLTVGFSFNGLRLYTNTSPPKLIAYRALNLWGPVEIKWIDNSSILAKSYVSDTTNAELQRIEYLKVSWK